MPIRKYGREFSTEKPLDVELFCFRERLTVEQGGLGRTQHFIRICKEIWPTYEWHEWAEEMAEALCEYDVSGFTSGASSGKSEILAKYILVSWFCDPVHTLCIVCSTTAIDARQKVWGHIVRNFREARAQKKSVGHLVESMNIIRLTEKSDGLAASDNSSISLVAAGDAFKDDSLKRLQGRHQKKVLLALDELQDCSQEIITTALGNLSANTHFEVHAAGNASSRYDTHGLFLTPVEGWTSVNRTTHKWKIRAAGKEGIGVHFDSTSEDSPNMKRAAAGLPQIPYMRKAEEVLVWQNTYGIGNPTFLRQFVGFWPESEGESNYLVTDVALTSHEAYDRAEWKSAPTMVAGIDPAFSNDGDRFELFPIKYGLTTHDVWTIEFQEAIQIKPRLIKGEDIHHANIRECKGICGELAITPRHVGMDASAGNPLISIAHKEWSPDILGTQFGGAASDLQISTFDKRIASDMYANRTSELTGVFVEFLNAGQIRGVKPDHAKELCARQFSIVAGGKIKIEPKKEMKKRVGYSPDISDAGMVAINVLRERLRVQAGEHSPQSQQTGKDWKALQRRRDVVTMAHRPHAPSKDLTESVVADMNHRSMMKLRDALSRGF